MKKIYLYSKWVIFILIFYVVIQIILFIYEITRPYPIKEIKRISNISNTVDAILAIREVGATDSTPNLVYVLPKNTVLNTEIKPILTALYTENNINLIWNTDDKLTIKIEEGLIHSFEGYTYADIKKNLKKTYIKLDVDKYYVE